MGDMAEFCYDDELRREEERRMYCPVCKHFDGCKCMKGWLWCDIDDFEPSEKSVLLNFVDELLKEGIVDISSFKQIVSYIEKTRR